MKTPAKQKQQRTPAKSAKLHRRLAPKHEGFDGLRENGPMMAALYSRAEAQLSERARNRRPLAAAPKSEADSQRLLHELEVHQVELEMQNAELQKARDELELALENYTDLYDFAPVGYFTLASNGTINLVNLTGAYLVGTERSRLMGRPFGQLVSPGHRPAFNSFLKNAFASQTKQSGVFELLINGQQNRIVSIEARSLLNGQDCRAVVVDVTERKKANDKMRISEIRYRRLFETANDGVLLLDPGTRKITEANPFMTTLLGYSQDELIGKELFEIGLLKDEPASQEMFRKLKRKHEVRYEDLPLESQTGRHQEVEVVANLYQENDRSVIQCNIRDITERKQAEIALTRLAAIVESSHDAIIGKNLEGIVTDWNSGAEAIFGYTAREMVGKSIRRLIPADRSDEEDQILEKIRRGESVEQFETQRKTKKGRLIDVSVTASPIKEASGKVIGVSKMARDITELKRTELAHRRLEVLAASNKKLEKEILRRQSVEESLKKSEQHQIHLLKQAHEMQDQLREVSRQVLHAQEEERKRISRELHDVIAQTLTGISIRLGSLKMEAGLDLKEFSRNIVRTQRLVEKSVDIVHRFALELRPAVLDDLGLIPALHSFLKTFTAQTGVRASLTAFAGVEKLDTGRRTVLFRVAQEALTNVARHAKASRVEVSIQKVPNFVCMKIMDDGKSFNAEGALHAKGGKRLGLLGMRERLEMVHGSFHVESSPGKGTTIKAQIPFHPQTGEASAS